MQPANDSLRTAPGSAHRPCRGYATRTTASRHDAGARRAAGRRGATLAEFAIVAPMFALIMMGTADVSRALYHLVTLQHAVREAGRLVMTGGTLEGQSRLESAISILRSSSQIDLADADIDVSAVDSGGTTTPGPGGPGDVVTIHVRYDVPMITPIFEAFLPNGTYTVDAATSFRNEEFSPSS